MKRKTCKILVWVGIILILSPNIFYILYNISNSEFLINLFLLISLTLSLFIPIGIIFLVVAWVSWNSEERKANKKELRDLQIKSLRQSVKRGKTRVELKGKMRKLR